MSAYTKVSHSVVRNPRLTSDAKVLLVYLQGLPESAATTKPLGEHALDLGMKPRTYQKAKESLTTCGHLHEWRWQDGQGLWKAGRAWDALDRTSLLPGVPDGSAGAEPSRG
ncbi:hypothetical protein [Streptomyces sp. NPDC056049]|uniref:hypothetical protein n=1 Tax=Streptomyces sp. NPDC056049 TaxID=3345693 RepID=UPI0035D673BD